MRAAIGRSGERRPGLCRALMLALQVITAVGTKPAKLLVIPFLFVLRALFQALSVSPPPEPSLCETG